MLRDLTDGHRTIRKWLTTRRLRRRFRKAEAFTVEALPEDTFGRITGAAQPFETTLPAPISVALHYREAVIEIGETVSVLGSGTREPDPDAPPSAAYRDGSRTRLRLTSSKQHPLCITDDPRIL